MVVAIRYKVKNIGKPYAGKLHVRFDEEGLGHQSFTLQTPPFIRGCGIEFAVVCSMLLPVL